MQIIQYSDSSKFYQKLKRFCERTATSDDVSGLVSKILEEVRKNGDRALLEFTAKYDGVTLSQKTLQVPPDTIKAAKKCLSARDRRLICSSITCVRDFHKRTLPKNWQHRNIQGGIAGECFYPINRVGIYIPGGSVPLVSTVVMTAVLAKLAKCPNIIVCTPPGKDGSVSPGILSALELVGVKEVYNVGGAQAVAAMAYGTQTIPAVDKIFGPGNAFVTEAKRQLFGTVGIDLLPGPSEVMIIADGGANPTHIAADILAQAEHGSGKEIIYLASTSDQLIQKTERALTKLLPNCTHAKACEKIIKHRFIAIKVLRLEQAAEVANFIAPEHLELQVDDKHINNITKQVTTAGAILQGYMTPTVMGDFTAGPSHTLPTGRTGRFSSGLQATDFMRRTSIVRYDSRSLNKAASVVETFARLEQLDAHGRSLEVRIKK